MKDCTLQPCTSLGRLDPGRLAPSQRPATCADSSHPGRQSLTGNCWYPWPAWQGWAPSSTRRIRLACAVAGPACASPSAPVDPSMPARLPRMPPVPFAPPTVPIPDRRICRKRSTGAGLAALLLGPSLLPARSVDGPAGQHKPKQPKATHRTQAAFPARPEPTTQEEPKDPKRNPTPFFPGNT